MANTTANGITIEYDVRGEGEPLLLVMGLGGQLIDWTDEVVGTFVDAGFQVIRFDNRDVGLSTQTDWEPPNRRRTLWSMVTRRTLTGTGYTVADMAGDAVAVLDALDHPSAHVVGVSMGGMIVQEMAIQYPERVRSLCSIMSNTGDRKNGGIAGSLIRRLARMEEPTEATAVDESVELFGLISGPHFDAARQRELAEEDVARAYTPAGVARQTAAIAATRDRTELLGAVAAPALVIHGLVDPLVKPSGGIATANAIPGSRLLGFGDMGHDIPLPRLPEICDAIVANTRRAQAPVPA